MAKKFRFAFDKLLGLARQELKAKESEMMRAAEEIRAKEREIDDIEGLVSATRTELAEVLKATAGARTLQVLNNYLMSLETRKAICARDLDRLNFAFSQLKDSYIEKRKEVMAMEQLYTRRRADYVRSLEKADQKFMDEVAQRKV